MNLYHKRLGFGLFKLKQLPKRVNTEVTFLLVGSTSLIKMYWTGVTHLINFLNVEVIKLFDKRFGEVVSSLIDQ